MIRSSLSILIHSLRMRTKLPLRLVTIIRSGEFKKLMRLKVGNLKEFVLDVPFTPIISPDAVDLRPVKSINILVVIIPPDLITELL